MRVTVLSLNIWNYRGEWAARRERIARVIREVAPDVVGLQEVRHDPRYARGVDQAAQLARLSGLHHVYGPAMRY
jgi:endonuclease/exonuclease/phosphatase family metal-dependent hydrolase